MPKGASGEHSNAIAATTKIASCKIIMKHIPRANSVPACRSGTMCAELSSNITTAHQSCMTRFCLLRNATIIAATKTMRKNTRMAGKKVKKRVRRDFS